MNIPSSITEGWELALVIIFGILFVVFVVPNIITKLNKLVYKEESNGANSDLD